MVCEKVRGCGEGDEDGIGLSAAERRVAEGICRGLTEKEIAEGVYRSQHTIHTQMKAIYKKLGIRKDTELLWWMLCWRLGIMFDLGLIRRHGIYLLVRI